MVDGLSLRSNRARAISERPLKITLAVGLLALAGAVAFALSQSPATVARTNTTAHAFLTTTRQRLAACQSGETLPRGTSAIRLRIETFLGPRVTVQVREGTRTIASGEHGTGWTAGVVTVPVKPLPATHAGVELCYTVYLDGYESGVLVGEQTTGALAARTSGGRLPGRIVVEYLRPGGSSWWSRIGAVARRMALGRAWPGLWSVVMVLALMIGVGALCSRAILRGAAVSKSKTPPKPPGARPGRSPKRVGARAFERQASRRKRPVGPGGRQHSLERWLQRSWPSPRQALRRVPSVAWLCALVACLNAVAWSLITPPFQVPDEPEHIAYVKQLAETGHLPAHTDEFSLEEGIALEELKLQTVAEKPELQPISTSAQQHALERILTEAEQKSGPGSRGAGVAASQPPLYYALEAIPYTLGKSGTLLDRIELMRLLSALMAGLTALFTYMFVREALPGVRWAWLVGGLGVALVPLLGFMSGAVNPDAMLYAVTAALFYCLARAFRRGLQRRSAIVLGAVVAIGFATKLNFVGIAPGALLGLVILSVQAARRLGRAAYVSLAIALAIALSPPLVYVAAHVASGAAPFGIVTSAFDLAHGSPLVMLSYIWQLYLPRLPGTHGYFGGLFTAREIWFKGYVGLYGWLDTTFPGWVYELALIPAVAIAGLCVRSLVSGVSAVRARALEIGVYLLICVGLMALIGADSYLAFPRVGAEYGQVRYLLPLLPLLGVTLALAARGAGRRWGPATGVAILILFLAHDVLSQLQTVARFYG